MPFIQKSKMIYLDNNASTKIHEKVLQKILPYYTDLYMNPSNVTNPYGLKITKDIEQARENVAQLIHADKQEITFTSGATEGINWILQTIPVVYKAKGNHIITSNIEHSAVLNTLFELAKNEVIEVSYLQPDANGIVQPEELLKHIKDSTILVAISLVNNEIGVIQSDIQVLAAIAHQQNALFFSDITQAMGKMKIDIKSLGIDIAVFSGHKFHAPKGVGIVYLSRKQPRVTILPMLHGGGQENSKRSGTENVPAIIGMGVMAALIIENQEIWEQKLKNIQQKVEEVCNKNSNIYLTSNEVQRIPNTFSIYFKYLSNKEISDKFSNFIFSNGSACQVKSSKTSHVLKSMGYNEIESQSVARFSFSILTTNEEVDSFLSILESI